MHWVPFVEKSKTKISRTRAREEVLKFLYRFEMTGERVESLLKDALETLGENLGEERAYFESLLKGVIDKSEELDRMIEPYLENWRMERVNVIERCILRLALYEMIYFKDIPHPVSIDSAVELAKKFSSKEAGIFVNGVLDSIRKRIDENENRNSSTRGN